MFDKLKEKFHSKDHHSEAPKENKVKTDGEFTRAEENVAPLGTLSQGHYQTTPPKVQTEPIEPFLGDYANSKRPTDILVVVEGELVENTEPFYTNEKQVQSGGTFYEPRDTQGGSTSNPEATHVKYRDTRGLKTNPEHVIEEQRHQEQARIHHQKHLGGGEYPDLQFRQAGSHGDYAEGTPSSTQIGGDHVNRSVGHAGGISATIEEIKEAHKEARTQDGSSGPETIY